MTGLAFLIEPLGTAHERRGFYCGEAALDGYLQRYARQHMASNISRTYVACQGPAILGYYSLAMAAFQKGQLPGPYQGRFPNFPLPVARLARLAVDKKHQRQGLGELLLADALCRCSRLAQEIGMVGAMVDAKDESAKAYYQRFEFESPPDHPLTLWLPMAAIVKLCGKP